MKSLTCVIVTKNRPQSLSRLLESLREQSLKDFEIIVVNDGGEPFDEPLDEKSTKVIYHSKSKGSGQARNEGVKKSKGEIILLLDDDVELISKDFLEKGIQGFTSSKIGIVFPTKIDVGQKKTEELSFFRENPWTGELVKTTFDATSAKSIKGEPILGAMVAFVRKKAFLNVRGYDSVFGWGIGHSFREESDFQLRLQEKGWGAVLVPTISFYHHIQSAGGHGAAPFKKIFWIAHNQTVFGARHLGFWPLKQVFFASVELPRYAWGSGRLITYPAGLLGAGTGYLSFAYDFIKSKWHRS